ncbi:MAG: DNA-3-methyladenine glycosylase [Acidimicrobiales bacterium]
MSLPAGTRPLPRTFYERDSLDVAPDLLNKVLIGTDGRRGRIIEVEAYRGPEDPGSHAFRGKTPRNATMWGPAGHLYVYFIYGMHWCANVVCGDEGVAQAVLLRAVAPESGLPAMRSARWSDGLGAPQGAAGPRRRPDRDLCRGPGRLCQAFGITGSDDGADLVAPADPGRAADLVVGDDGQVPPEAPMVTTRVGLRAGAELPWRFAVAGHQGVSRWTGIPRRSRPGLR